jgi:hypothetical protein
VTAIHVHCCGKRTLRHLRAQESLQLNVSGSSARNRYNTSKAHLCGFGTLLHVLRDASHRCKMRTATLLPSYRERVHTISRVREPTANGFAIFGGIFATGKIGLFVSGRWCMQCCLGVGLVHTYWAT